jgi:hypothetical protein
MNQDQPRLLMIAYLFPPVQAVSTLRWYHLYQEGRRYFSQITVISARHWRYLHHDPQLKLAFEPHLIPAFDLRGLTLLRQNRPYVPHQLKQRPWVNHLLRLLDAFPFNLLLGDGGIVYILRGYHLGVKLVKKEKITHLISSFRPYSDHAIAWLLKWRFPHLYWIADFRDLHIDPSRPLMYLPTLQRWFNQKIIKRASLVTTVSEGLGQQLRFFHSNIYVLRNGIDPHSSVAENDQQVGSKFVIAYTGSLYPGFQNPALLFEALFNLMQNGLLTAADVQLVYAGKDGDFWQKELEVWNLASIAIDRGMLSLQDARGLQQQSCLNVLLSWATPDLQGILTGKLYEYLAARKPILALVEGAKDPELELILEQTQSGRVFYAADLRELEIFILTAYRNWQKTSGSMPLNPADKLQDFTWPVLMDRLAETIGLLENTVAQSE